MIHLHFRRKPRFVLKYFPSQGRLLLASAQGYLMRVVREGDMGKGKIWRWVILSHAHLFLLTPVDPRGPVPGEQCLVTLAPRTASGTKQTLHTPLSQLPHTLPGVVAQCRQPWEHGVFHHLWAEPGRKQGLCHLRSWLFTKSGLRGQPPSNDHTGSSLVEQKENQPATPSENKTSLVDV